MMKTAAYAAILALVVLATPPPFVRAQAPGNHYLSPLALAVHGESVLVAAFTARHLAVFDTTHDRVTRVIPLDGEPTGIAVAHTRDTAYVTGGGHDGRVYIVHLPTGTMVGALVAGHTPTAPVLSPKENLLFVCDRFDNTVSAYNLASRALIGQAPVTREPVAAAITPDGQTLFVANLLPAGRADADYVAAVVDVIDVASMTVAEPIALPNGSTGLHGICLSPDGRYAYVTHILARYQLPTTQLERGWINTNAVSVIDVERRALVNTVLLDDLDLGAANPWGITCSADGKWLCVAQAGTHELSIIDRDRLHEKLAHYEASGNSATVPNHLAFLFDIRERVRMKGNGPRGVAAAGMRVYAAEYFSGSLGAVDLGVEGVRPVHSFSLGREPALDQVRAGELFFNDATKCFQQWQSCASCHPGDARVDGLNWDLLNDGLGNPKNNKSLLLAHQTPPSMITGVRDSAETAVRAGIRHILFNEHPEEAAESVDAYLKSLQPVPSPYLEDGKLSAAAERGKALFDSAGCARCHPAPLFTDMKLHRVGTGTGREANQAFDTPTLVELWRTAPYLYDGRAATIHDVLTEFNREDKHGTTSGLSDAEIDDLAVYLLSL
jgi:DNA-binding beta-propeller fold protein YncE